MAEEEVSGDLGPVGRAQAFNLVRGPETAPTDAAVVRTGVGLFSESERQELREYQQRLREVALGLRGATGDAAPVAPEAPVAPGTPVDPLAPAAPGASAVAPALVASRWISIGPSAVRLGQADTRPVVSGRVVGIALAHKANRVYVATATGGVWRSDHGGKFWRWMMDGWDRDPRTIRSTTLACGAIVVDPADPDRVFVGTGETQEGQFGGIGPVFSADGGRTWQVEAVTPAGALAGFGTWALAMDPGDSNRIVAATTAGLFVREPVTPGPGFQWRQVQPGTHNSVVAARAVTGGATVFYASLGAGGVVTSPDGVNWTAINDQFPTANVGRIVLAVQPGNTAVVYALVGDASGAVLGLWRRDTAIDGKWRPVPGVLADLYGSGSQGFYDSALAVDPGNVNVVYMGGATRNTNGQAGSCLDRGTITVTGTGAATTYAMASVSIGGAVHADLHTLVIDPEAHERLWVGCDGGVFMTNELRLAAPRFQSMNGGLANLNLSYLALHPTTDAMMIVGTQDCGSVRYTGEEVWLHSSWGDGGFGVIDWNNPHRMLTSYYGNRYRTTTDGGQQAYPVGASWAYGLVPGVTFTATVQNAVFYPPFVGTPRNAANAAEANRVAYGYARVAINDGFGLPGSPWTVIGNALPVLGDMYISLRFASHTRLYGGTVRGGVFRHDFAAGAWTETRLDTRTGGLPSKPITDIAVDPSDATGSSIYVTLGRRGGDYKRVWRYDGTADRWEARSGPSAGAATALPNIHFSAVEADPAHPTHVYAGADTGIWRSVNNGVDWTQWAEGLPDAAVLDLQLHAPSRVMRASVYGRGCWERKVDDATVPPVEVYVRRHQTDPGRGALPVPTAANPAEADPTVAPGTTVAIGKSPDIRIDVPDNTGTYQSGSENIDFVEFVDKVTDRSAAVATLARSQGTLTNRVFVQVHNRGPRGTSGLRVVALLAEAPGGVPPALPAGFDALIRAGTPINASGWKTLGSQTVNDVRAGVPQVAYFPLLSTDLPEPSGLTGHASWCIVTILHNADDPFVSTTTDPMALCRADRKVALRTFTVAAFTGSIPAPRQQGWLRIMPIVANWPVSGGPPIFDILCEENGTVIIELAWDPQALLAPSVGYDDEQALRYFCTRFPTGQVFDKTIQKVDGTALRVRVGEQNLTTSGRRLTWTMPAILWQGFQEEARKAAATPPTSPFTRVLYYRARHTAIGSASITDLVNGTANTGVVLWPPTRTLLNNPDAPHIGIVVGTTAARPPIPDPSAVDAMPTPGLRDVVRGYWQDLPDNDVDRQSLVRVFGHNVFRNELSTSQKGAFLQLWVTSGPSSRQRVDRLLDQRVWQAETQTVSAAACRDPKENLTLMDQLMALHYGGVHADLRAATTAEQLVDDVINEILDPNGQLNQGDGIGPPCAVQGLLIQRNPAEYVRLQRGWLGPTGRAVLANGDAAPIPPGIFQLARYGAAQQGAALTVRTFSELAFHGAMMAYGKGTSFPQYDPAADPGAPTGINTVFAAATRNGLTKAEHNRVLVGLFGRPFTASADGPSTAVKDSFLAQLARNKLPLIAALRWAPGASTVTSRAQVVLALREENGRVFFKNPQYAGSAPPSGVTAGASLTNPARRADDPTQALESMSTADFGGLLLWFQFPVTPMP